jgi:hypothetical protein
VSSHTLKWVFLGPDEAHSRLNGGHQSFRYGRNTTRIGAARWRQLVPRCTPGRQIPSFLEACRKTLRMQTYAEDRPAVAAIALGRSQDWVHHVISLLDAAMHQLYRTENTAHRTILKAASLLRAVQQCPGPGKPRLPRTAGSIASAGFHKPAFSTYKRTLCLCSRLRDMMSSLDTTLPLSLDRSSAVTSDWSVAPCPAASASSLRRSRSLPSSIFSYPLVRGSCRRAFFAYASAMVLGRARVVSYLRS